MDKIIFPNTNSEISMLGFGCMRFPTMPNDPKLIDEEQATLLIDKAYQSGVNYFDTAWGYHSQNSQYFMGKALKKYPRDSFYLATKFPMGELKEEADMERVFSEQLKRCQVDYFDFYLCHGLSGGKLESLKKHKVFDFFNEKKKQGLIKNLGFSFHDTPEVLKTFLELHPWDFVQLQINYLDWNLIKAKEMYELATKMNIPIIVMEPVRGGLLARLTEKSSQVLKNADSTSSLASWAMRYVGSLPNVRVILSGMSDMEQVDDNIKTFTDFKPLDKNEYKVIDETLEAFYEIISVPCTGCEYCMDCPVGVDIPTVFSMYINYQLTENKPQFKNRYGNLPDEKKAVNCIDCKVCEGKCPQAIKIPDFMTEINEFAISLNS